MKYLAAFTDPEGNVYTHGQKFVTEEEALAQAEEVLDNPSDYIVVSEAGEEAPASVLDPYQEPSIIEDSSGDNRPTLSKLK